MLKRLLICFANLLIINVIDASPAVTNRPPKPDELGYRPEDATVSLVNPPSMVWLHEPEAAKYCVQWSRQSNFVESVTIDAIPFNTYTYSESLIPGKYFWRYRYINKKNETSDWSQIRTYTIPPESVQFPMPSRAQQKERVPQTHPRLFLRPEDLPQIRSICLGTAPSNIAAQSRYPKTDLEFCQAQFRAIQKRADQLLLGEPTPEPTIRGSNRDDKTRSAWWPNREQALKACGEAETLAWTYLITGEKQYGEAARKWILHLAAWDPDGPTNFQLNDEAAFPLLHRLPRAYDWAYNALSSDDRDKVRKVMLRRATDVWKSGQVGYGYGHFNKPFNSHANRAWHKLGECAIAFYKEIPEAENWLDFAVNKFHACYPVWADDDGGWHEGLSYWAGYMTKAVWWLHISKNSLAVDGFKKPFFTNIGDFPIYLAPPHSPNMGFGDLSFRPPSGGWGSFLDYFARGNGNGHLAWYMDQYNMKPETGIMGILYRIGLPPAPKAQAPIDLAPSKVFKGIGIASLHLNLTNSLSDIHLLFKSSPFGSQSHGHNPQNSFELNAFGDELLSTCVYRDYHGSKFHYQWAHSTIAQNAVLVNNQGQVMHKAGPLGRIVDFELNKEYDYVDGDATPAYDGRMTHYNRRILFSKPDFIIIYDDLAASEPSTFQFMLHSLKSFTLNPDKNELAVERSRAGVVIQYLSPVDLNYRQWDGFDPKPQKEFPNQWHVEASTQSKERQMHMLTLIAPYASGNKPRFQAQRVESDTAIGVKIEQGSLQYMIAFRKVGYFDTAKLGNYSFTGPFKIWKKNQ